MGHPYSGRVAVWQSSSRRAPTTIRRTDVRQTLTGTGGGGVITCIRTSKGTGSIAELQESMNHRQGSPPSAEELQAYSLGKCESQRAGEIEAFLADGPDCRSILEGATEDALVSHLRGAGELPPWDASPSAT